MYSTLSSFNTTTEVSLSKTPNPHLLPGRRSINGCPLLRVCVHGVCVHFGWVKCRAQIPSMGHHTWLYVTSLSFTFTSYCVKWERLQFYCLIRCLSCLLKALMEKERKRLEVLSDCLSVRSLKSFLTCQSKWQEHFSVRNPVGHLCV